MSKLEEYTQRISDIISVNKEPIWNLQLLGSEIRRDKALSDDEVDNLLVEIDDNIQTLRTKELAKGNDYVEYDYSKINVHLEPWENLNKDKKPYPIFLRDYILPTFHPMPEGDLQYPLLATYCLINSNSLPPASSGILKEIPLSILYISGVSGSGKTELQKRIATHYPANRKYLWMGDSTGTGLIRECDRVCRVSDDTLAPAYIWMDNFYPSGSNSTITRLGNSYTSVLSVLRSQAQTSSCTPTDTNTYYTHCLKSISSIMTVERASKTASELLRRCVFTFTERMGKVPSAGKYNWLSVKDRYMDFWTKEQTEEGFFPILSEVMSLGDDETAIPPQYFAQSGIVIATGCHVGLFKSVKEACIYLAEYWNWAEDRLNKPNDPVLGLVTYYLKENDMSGMMGGIVKSIKVSHSLSDIAGFVAEKLNSRRTTTLQDKVVEIMGELGYTQEVSRGGQIIFYRP